MPAGRFFKLRPAQFCFEEEDGRPRIARLREKSIFVQRNVSI